MIISIIHQKHLLAPSIVAAVLTNPPHSTLIDEFVCRYDELIDHLRRRFGDKGFAKDVLQDVCVQLLERPPENVRAPGAFLRHVSTQLAIDRYRVEKVRAGIVESMPDIPEQPVAHAALSGAELNIAFQQKQQALLAAVQALPECCRDVFILHKLYYLPQAEVANKLGISRGMVARHMARAVAGLAPVMNGET